MIKKVEKLVAELRHEVTDYMDHYVQPGFDKEKHPGSAEEFYVYQFRKSNKFGAPGGIRTPDTHLRTVVFYPAELPELKRRLLVYLILYLFTIRT